MPFVDACHEEASCYIDEDIIAWCGGCGIDCFGYVISDEIVDGVCSSTGSGVC